MLLPQQADLTSLRFRSFCSAEELDALVESGPVAGVSSPLRRRSPSKAVPERHAPVLGTPLPPPESFSGIHVCRMLSIRVTNSFALQRC